MEPTVRPRIKVCCICSLEEAWIAIQAGAAALGLVVVECGGPGVISAELAGQIAECVPPGVATFLLTDATKADAIVDLQRRTGAGALQLVDRVDAAEREAVRRALPGIKIVQVVHVVGPRSFDEAIEAARHSDALLLDSGTPDAAENRALGGTGRVHDWELSARIRKEVGVPVYLAGGLNAGNVGEAIARVRPFGLDVCTGVRSHGDLDPDGLARFFAAAHAVAEDQD